MILSAEEISGNDLILRHLSPTTENAACLSDLVQENYDHLKSFRSSVVYNAYHKNEALETLIYYDKAFKNGERLSYGIFFQNKLIGEIALTRSDEYNEIEYWIALKYTKRGFALRAVTLLEDVYFKDHDGVLYLEINPNNKASLAIARKLNYRKMHYGDSFYVKSKAAYEYFSNLNNIADDIKSGHCAA